MTPGGEPKQQAVVGLATLALIAVAAVFVVAIWPRLHVGIGVHVQVAFAHVGSLREGAPVIVAGRTIGKVESIALVDAGGLPPDHPLAGTGGAVAILAIDPGERGRFAANAEVFVSSRGVLSARYLEIGPPAGGAAPGPPIAAGAIVRGVDPPQIDRALQRTWDNLQRSRAFLEEVRPELDAFRAALDQLATTLDQLEPTPGAAGDLVSKVRGLLAELRTLRTTLDDAGADPDALAALAARAESTLDHARAAVASLRDAADRLTADLDRVRGHVDAVAPATLARLRTTLADADAQLARLQALAANARGLLALIQRGDGSLFKLSRDPEFPEDAKELGRIMKRTPWRILGHNGAQGVHPDP